MNTPSPQKRFKKVLLVDDDKVDVYISSRIIKATDFSEKVIAKSSASEALQFLQNFSERIDDLPEIIFLDLNMPEMDGFEFLNKFMLMNKTIRQHCRIVILSNETDAYPEKKMNKEISDIIHHYISKPLTVRALEEI